MTETILQPVEINPAVELANRALAELDRILLGRSELHRLVFAGVLSRGHILLEGLPGVGKTALVKALGGLFNLQFNRVQFTPDLMPSDILGAHILQENHNGRRAMEFHPGPIFTNLLLADEINRASPKTQSALLEAMQERSVTLLGSTRSLPDPFFVLASQNPIELEGTYPLPEAQLDRFLFKLNVTGADALIACWRGKYESPFWRPSTAIQLADTDNNPATTADPTWTPLLVNPPYPDYPSGHACLTGATSNGLAHLFGARHINLALSSAVTGTTRQYGTAQDLDRDTMNARIWLGIHFRTAMTDGNQLGHRVSHWALRHYFQPVG
jgi:hypothetical protein